MFGVIKCRLNSRLEELGLGKRIAQFMEPATMVFPKLLVTCPDEITRSKKAMIIFQLHADAVGELLVIQIRGAVKNEIAEIRGSIAIELGRRSALGSIMRPIK